MKKVAFYSSKQLAKCDLSWLASRFEDQKYGKSNAGYIVSDYRRNTIEASFIEKRTAEIEILEPDGSLLKQNQVFFIKVDFIIHKGNPSIQVNDPPRSLKEFFNSLSWIFDGRLAISPSKVDLFRLSEIPCLKGFSPIRIFVSGAPIGRGISVTGEVRGAAELSSWIAKNLMQEPSRLVAVEGAISPRNEVFQERKLILRSSGSVTSNRAMSPEMILKLRSCFS